MNEPVDFDSEVEEAEDGGGDIVDVSPKGGRAGVKIPRVEHDMTIIPTEGTSDVHQLDPNSSLTALDLFRKLLLKN